MLFRFKFPQVGTKLYRRVYFPRCLPAMRGKCQYYVFTLVPLPQIKQKVLIIGKTRLIHHNAVYNCVVAMAIKEVKSEDLGILANVRILIILLNIYNQGRKYLLAKLIGRSPVAKNNMHGDLNFFSVNFSNFISELIGSVKLQAT